MCLQFHYNLTFLVDFRISTFPACTSKTQHRVLCITSEDYSEVTRGEASGLEREQMFLCSASWALRRSCEDPSASGTRDIRDTAESKVPTFLGKSGACARVTRLSLWWEGLHGRD